MNSAWLRRLWIVVSAAFVPAISAQTPLGTGFTYQGQLDQSGVPAEGSYAMVFSLWDAATDGAQVGPTLSFDGAGGNPPPVIVADGLFNVPLDFGAGAMGTNARWLETTVNGVTLSPRQRITPAPAALFAAAPWATSGSTISYTGGNVGIGTTSPNAPLDIRSNSAAGTAIGLTNPPNDGTAWSVRVDGNGVTNNRYSFRIRDDFQGIDRLTIDGWETGYVGIGTNTPTARLTVAGGIHGAGQTLTHSQGLHMEWNKTGSDGTTYLLNQRGLGLLGGFVFGEISTANVVTERMRIDGNGKVGIGAFPFNDNLLTVNGDTYCSGTLTSGQVNSDFVDCARLQTDSRIQWGVDGQNSDPIRIERVDISADRTALRMTIGDNPGGGAAYDDFQIYAGNSFQFQFTSDGRAFKVGFPGWETLSDARSKHDVQPLIGALDRILQLRGRTFHYNEPASLGARAGQCIGFVAQEVEPIFPEWVGTGPDGMKSMHVTGFEALTVEALRNLRQEKDSEIAALRAEKDAQIRDLSARLARLEAMMVKKASDSGAD